MEERRAVGGVYLTFLLPAMMGLFAQVGGAETPAIWRVAFVGVAIVGCYLHAAAAAGAPSGRCDQRPRGKYVATLVIYLLIAVIGAAPRSPSRSTSSRSRPRRSCSSCWCWSVTGWCGTSWSARSTGPVSTSGGFDE